MMKKLNIQQRWGLAALLLLPLSQACADLLISEYIEGSSNNKALEFYNATGAPIDLSAGQYVVQMHFNGSTTVGTTINLTGIVVAGDVFVLANSLANPVILAQADQTNSSTWYNGDDAIVLRKGGAMGTIVDAIGQVGVDPGAEWGTGLTSTADNTLRRKSTIALGDANPNDAFDPSIEWDGFATDTVDGLGSHTFVGGAGGGTTLAIAATDATKAEGNSSNTDFIFTVTRSGNTSGTTVVNFATANGTAVAGLDYITHTGTANFAATETTKTIRVMVFGDTTAEPDETFTVTLSGATGGATITTATATGTIQNDDVGITKIHDLQGTTDISPWSGQTVAIQGIVVADFQDDLGPNRIRGFYVQEEALDQDTNPLTSEGIFVYCDTCLVGVNVGDNVTILGTVSEFQNQTQLGGALTITINATAQALPSASVVRLPFPDAMYLERFEGMLVTFPDPLYVTELFQLGRFGEVTLASDNRLWQPTEVALPGLAANAVQAANDLNRIILDDFTNAQNPDPIIFGLDGNPLTAANTLRGGDSVIGLTGVLTYSWGGNSASPNAYRVRVRQSPFFMISNPRLIQAPDTGNANLKIAAFNVLNYFNTLDAPGSAGCFPSMTRSDCRGADSAIEFTRQSDKIVAAIQSLNADVLALNELENDGFGVNSSIQDLVNKVNAVMGAGTYAFAVPVDGNGNPFANVGGDAITVGFLYKPAVVEIAPGSSIALLTTGEFDPVQAARHRVPIAATFLHKASQQRFTAVVVHLKSKGSLTGLPQDNNQGDGQGNNNYSRTNAALELRAWLATNPTGNATNKVMILGDFNAYGLEDPMRVFTNNGFIDLVRGYSFVFDGQWGSLDHVVVSPAFERTFVAGGKYHINADEPRVLDYNVEFKSTNQVNTLYNADPFRSSDHDPLLVGFLLNAPRVINNANDLVDAVANASPGDQIDLSHLSGSLNLPAPLVVNTSLTIGGASAFSLAITGSNQQRIFEVRPGALLTLSDVSLERGNGRQNLGGALLNEGSVSLNRVMIRGNFALDGGAIYNAPGADLTIANSLIYGNLARNHGGAIYNAGNLLLGNVTLVFNRATREAGGIYHNGGDLVLWNSLIWNNQDANGRSAAATPAISVTVAPTKSITQRAGSLIQGFDNSSGNLDGRFSATNYPGLSRMANVRFLPLPSFVGRYDPLPSGLIVNAGNNSFYSTPLFGAFDLVGAPRQQGASINIGAFE